MAYRNYAPSNGFLVNADGSADFTSVNSAIVAAIAGQTVYLHGTVTENVTLKVGVDVVSWPGEGLTPNATIIGTCTLTTAGTVTISGIQLQTNSAALLAVTGTLASVVNLNNCYLNATNNSAITFSSSSASSAININNCNGDQGTTGIAFFAGTTAGTLSFNQTIITNTGNNLTASTFASSGLLKVFGSKLAMPITTSATSIFQSDFSQFSSGANNFVTLTVNGTGGGNSYINNSSFGSGTSSAISVGAGVTLVTANVVVTSSNTNPVTGAGTIDFSNFYFTTTSGAINTTTQSGGTVLGSKNTAPAAGFLGEQIRSYAASGAGTALSNGVIAPVTNVSLTAGVWDVSCVCEFTGLSTATLIACGISTSPTSFSAANGDGVIHFPIASTTGSPAGLSIPSFRVIVSATTTYYLAAIANFTVSSSPLAYGRISGTRIG